MIPSILLMLASILPIQPQVQAQITPIPADVVETGGTYVLPIAPRVSIDAPEKDSARLESALNSMVPGIMTVKGMGDINLTIEPVIEGITSPEGYKLTIDRDGINVKATAGAGLFYGLQTLGQLVEASDDWSLPTIEITDEPRLAYRGMMLDISRHFHDADFIRKQIDAIAALKLNRLHLHLTDGAGWRIEIKKYPELTEYAAWRPQALWSDWETNGCTYAHEGDTDAYGGYLTQQQARDLVQYAADRYITIIPEIEMPSHSAEVTATFPELSCTHEPYNIHDVCVGNEKTFEFLEGVLEEVIEIFPSEYIHIGGDEANKGWWKSCELCQERMQEENLKDVDQLQSYMVHRIEKWLNAHDRNLLGWDEIMEGGLAPNATVMTWRGIEGGMRAAQSGHDAIMCPGAYCYFDGYQDAPYTQPQAFGGYLPLSKVYSYNPVPDSIGPDIAKHITGIQGNLWCEYVPTGAHAEYMLYPRMIAISEIGWSPQSRRDWNDFHDRALAMTDRMRANGYNAFDLRNEIGNRPETQRPEQHLAVGKKVIYNVPYWNRYPAQGDATLTDGVRGGWNYNDQLWQGFLYRKDQRVDVTIDMDSIQPIRYIGAEFMQMCTPDVWMPQRVVISASADNENYTTLKEITHEQVHDDGVTFRLFDWSGEINARYVRYQAYTDRGVLFTDEIIVR